MWAAFQDLPNISRAMNASETLPKSATKSKKRERAGVDSIQ